MNAKPTVRYLNWRYPGQPGQPLETIDELSSADYPGRAFRAEMRRLVEEYNMGGMTGCYWSTRPCKAWGKP
jgi:hypothetical protein